MNKNYLLPGEPLRKGVDLIADKKSGGLIVVGSSNKLENL
jgi:DNA integrity scanning protein DisA with diadenylate cyclase activity